MQKIYSYEVYFFSLLLLWILDLRDHCLRQKSKRFCSVFENFIVLAPHLFSTSFELIFMLVHIQLFKHHLLRDCSPIELTSSFSLWSVYHSAERHGAHLQAYSPST